jgi:hypothetical protein
LGSRADGKPSLGLFRNLPWMRLMVKGSISGRFTQAMRYWLICLADRLNQHACVVSVCHERRASRIDDSDKLPLAYGAAWAISAVDGGTGHDGSDNQQFADCDVWLDGGCGVYDFQCGDDREHHSHNQHVVGVGARGSELGYHLRHDVCVRQEPRRWRIGSM